VWDLTGAVAVGPTLGDTVADLLIEELIDRAGIPGFLESAARSKLRSLVRAPIVAFVNAHTPGVFDADSGVLAGLTDALSDVEVVSELTLRAVPGDATRFEGVERIIAVRVHAGTTVIEVPIDALLPVLGADALAADLTGAAVGDDGLVFDAHELSLRSDPLALLGVLGFVSLPSLDDLAAEVLDCPAIIDAMTGGASLSFTVSGHSFSIGFGTLVSACEAVRAEALEMVLGFTRTDIGVTTGGPAVMFDDDGDARADEIVAADGFAGALSFIPDVIASEFDIAFSAVRQ
jgi:hypothetical protein